MGKVQKLMNEITQLKGTRVFRVSVKVWDCWGGFTASAVFEPPINNDNVRSFDTNAETPSKALRALKDRIIEKYWAADDQE